MGASRPHRHAKAVHSYKEAFSDDDDFSTRSKAHPRTLTDSTEKHEKDSGRKNLALKRTSRSQERANAKERAEAVQLERAIRESLSQDDKDLKRVSSESFEQPRSAKDIADSDDEVVTIARSNSVAFQYLLDVASEAGHSENPIHANEAAVAVVEDTATNDHEEKETSTTLNIQSYCNDDLSNHGAESEVNAVDGKRRKSLEDVMEGAKEMAKEDDDWSFEGEEEEDDDSEDYSSDDSDDSECKRKRPKKSQQKDKTTVKKQSEDDKKAVQVKKARSNRPVSKARTPLSENRSSTVLSIGKGPVVQAVDAAGGKENHSAGCTMKVMKKSVTSSIKPKETRTGSVTLDNCQTVEEYRRPFKVNKSPLLENVTSESPGTRIFQVQSPTLPHRRVIGLSRRFRPPPLHPYLPKTVG